MEQLGCREVDTAHDGRISNRADELKIGLEELVSLEPEPTKEYSYMLGATCFSEKGDSHITGEVVVVRVGRYPAIIRRTSW